MWLPETLTEFQCRWRLVLHTTCRDLEVDDREKTNTYIPYHVYWNPSLNCAVLFYILTTRGVLSSTTGGWYPPKLQPWIPCCFWVKEILATGRTIKFPLVYWYYYQLQHSFFRNSETLRQGCFPAQADLTMLYISDIFNGFNSKNLTT